jgi:hypothetical protein
MTVNALAVAESMARLSVFGAQARPVVRHVADDWAAADSGGKTWRVPFTASSGAYAFGQPVVMTVAEVGALPEAEPAAPERTEETFTAKESEAMAFTASEGVLIGGQSYHANPVTGEYPVFVIAEGHSKAKRRQYTANALDKVQEDFYAGMPMHLDHAGKEGDLSVRSVRDFVGKVIKSGRAVMHEGVRKIPAVVRFFDEWTRKQMSDPDWRSGVGLSHVADVSGYVGRIGKDTVKVIESIVKPYAVDVVTSAAFGGKVSQKALEPKG